MDFGDSLLVHALVAQYARSHNGVWVGGTATVTAQTLEFRTNAANRPFHGTRGNATVSLALIQDIAIQRAFVSDIMAVRSNSSMIQVRCLRAVQFAADLWSAATQARLAVGDCTALPRVREVGEGRLASELVEILEALF